MTNDQPSCPAHETFIPRCDYCCAEANSKRRCDDCGGDATTRTLRDGDIANLCDECYRADDSGGQAVATWDDYVHDRRHELNETCPVCGATDHRAVMWADGVAWNDPDDDAVGMGFCGSCGAMYAVPEADG